MCDDCDDLADQVDELEEFIEFVQSDVDEWKRQVYRPHREKTAAERDDARNERVELKAAVDALERRVAELERTLDNVVGVEDAADSNPGKRANDLRMALLREAEERQDQHAGRTQMWWREVRSFFARTGHGQVSKPDCYKAMRWAAGADDAPDAFKNGAEGFDLTTKTNEQGNEVMAVSVDAEVASYADSGPEAPSSNPTTGNAPATAAETD